MCIPQQPTRICSLLSQPQTQVTNGPTFLVYNSQQHLQAHLQRLFSFGILLGYERKERWGTLKEGIEARTQHSSIGENETLIRYWYMHSSFKNSSYNGVRKHFMLRNSLHFPTFRKSYRCLRTPIRTSSRSFKNPLKIGTRSAAVNWSPRITASSWMEKARVRRTFHCKQANKGTTWGTVTKTNKLLNNPCERIETTGQTGLVQSVNHINCKSDLNL